MTRRQGAASESRPSRSHEAGWTLIELLVVISLIMVLAAMGLAQYRNSVTNAKEAVLKADLFRMREAIDQYYADKGQYPSGLDALVTGGSSRKHVNALSLLDRIIPQSPTQPQYPPAINRLDTSRQVSRQV